MDTQIYKVRDLSGNIREISGPVGASDEEILAQARNLFTKSESPAKREGRELNSSVQGFANAMQGPTFGFADEIYGGLSALGRSVAGLVGDGNGQTFRQNYEEGRDTVRGATDQFRKDNPLTATVTSLMASAPTMLIGGAGPVSNTAQAGIMARAATAGRTGAGFGAATGLGESEATDIAGMAGDTAKGAAISGALGAASQPIIAGMGAGGSVLMQRLNQASAADAARRRLAEVLMRDARGIGESNPTAQVAARLRKLGPEATLADAAGSNARQTLDTLASMPGTAKNATEALIHSRQATRAGRLVNAADAALGTQGKGYTATLEALEAAQKAAQAPHRAALEGLSVRADDDLVNLLKRVPDVHKAAESLALREGKPAIDLSLIKAGDDLPFDALDTIKKALWTIAEREKVNFAPTAESRATNAVRRALTDKMDLLSPKDAKGQSIYKLARDAFAGPAELQDAITKGRTAMKADAIGVAELMQGMGASEREAFRVGALQAIRDKVGTESGQTSLLKMWKEPATSGKLKEIFGNDYRAFAAEVAKEARLKLLESTGRGSQTASRLFGAGEMDAAQAAANAAGTVIQGMSNPVAAAPGVMGSVSRAWNQVKTPEATRNELARSLLLKGPQAMQELQALPQFLQRFNEEQQRRAAIAGALAGQSQK